MNTVNLSIAILVALLCARGVRAQPMPGEPLANPEAEFKIAVEEYVRLNRNDTEKPIRFNLDIYHAKQERAGKAIRATVHWDGDNLIVDSDHYVYVSAPHRAFVLHRDSRDLPLSIRALSPVSDSKRDANEIIKFDLKVEGGYTAAFRPTVRGPRVRRGRERRNAFGGTRVSGRVPVELGRIRTRRAHFKMSVRSFISGATTAAGPTSRWPTAASGC